MERPLAVVGVIEGIHPIEGADRIQLAKVNCGAAGTWSGVVSKDIQPSDRVTVFLQDALLPPNERWSFMEKQNWRVRMCRFKGVPSECLIVPGAPDFIEGTDLTDTLGVTKYEKPIPAGASADIAGNFPSWIPRTDEDNFQRVPELVEHMRDDHWYVTEKADGTSCTAWVDDDGLHVCSRNFELREFSESGATNLYWRVARQYKLENLPQGYAIQFEIVGPGVQGNPMGLKTTEMRLFNVYETLLYKSRMPWSGMQAFAQSHGLQLARQIEVPDDGLKVWTADDLQALAQIKYPNGRHGEGIVIRDTLNTWSFKVINLLYKD